MKIEIKKTNNEIVKEIREKLGRNNLKFSIKNNIIEVLEIDKKELSQIDKTKIKELNYKEKI